MKTKSRWLWIPLVITNITCTLAQIAVYKCENGKVLLHSDASLEVIQARCNKLKGVIDPVNQTFAWSVEVRFFEGFNSPLQREHFNENYMETGKYPKASFSGKIIEKTDFSQPGLKIIRAKGKLNIHGVEQERILKCQVENKGGQLFIKAEFTVPVADHNIAIPKIVHQKIAEEIKVTVDAIMIE
ncbi:MAG: YceI family protein [Saprospiraceae bacterium]|nr:YceI family protein [Saprospiraceae bacterium]